MQIMVDLKQPESVECFNYLSSMKTNDARCASEITSRIATTKTAYNKKNNLLTSTLDINTRKKLVKCCIWCLLMFVPKIGNFGR